MKWTIDKEFTFEMGHRVWAQKLNRPDLSISTECACKHLHGHSYLIKVFLTANELDNSQMVTDFKNLNFMKEFVDNVLDHKFMIDVNDPNFYRITGYNSKDVATRIELMLPVEEKNEPAFVNLGQLFADAVSDHNEQLHLDSFVIVNFVPTSENICKHLYLYAKERMADFAEVEAVELWETRKSHCRYEG